MEGGGVEVVYNQEKSAMCEEIVNAALHEPFRCTEVVVSYLT